MLNKTVKEPSIDMTSDSIIASFLDYKTESNHNDIKFHEFVHKNPFRYSLSITSEQNCFNQEKNIQEVNSESSSSVILEDSQDILVLNCKKLHGFPGSFNKKHGINLKKLRKCRYSEHNTNRNLNLQVDDDVQPEIASVKSSFAMSDRRQRARSCYTRISKKLSGEALLESHESDESIILSELDPIEENHANDPDSSILIIQSND